MKIRTVPVLAMMLAFAVTSIGLAGTGAQAAPPPATETHCAQNLDSGATTCAGSQEQAREDVGAQASYIVARLWTGTNYTGSSLTYYKSSGCTSTMGDREISVPVVPTGWNDLLSSVRTDLTTANTRCSVRIYEHGRFSGAYFTINYYTPNLGAFGWNNRASSWYIS